jgi:conjugal transfer ATP-binding protein TraC
MGAFMYMKNNQATHASELVPVESFDEETHLFTLADGYYRFWFCRQTTAGQ